MSYNAIMKHRPRSFACPGFHAAPLSRRQMIKVGGLGLLGLTLPQLLRAEALKKGPKAKAKSVIFLFQWGGPSHLDMFDMKPNAPEQIRGPHKPISSSADGIQVSERLPRVSKIMDKVTLIRSVYHTMKNHNSAGYYALSGSAPPSDDQRLRDSLSLFPAYGSVVDKLAPGPDIEKAWDEEWENTLLEAAMAAVKQRVSPKQYQIFYFHAFKKLPARQVAERLGVTLSEVYLAMYKVSALVKKEARKLESRID